MTKRPGDLDLSATPFGPVGSSGYGLYTEQEQLDTVRKEIARSVQSGQSYLASRGLVPALTETLALQLANYERRFAWQTYGGQKVAVAANTYIDITRTIDPRAYFSARQFMFFTTGTNDLTIQFIEAGGVEHAQRPVSLMAMNPIPTNGGQFIFPRDWILSPGDAMIMRVTNRTAVPAVIDAHVSGTKIFTPPAPLSILEQQQQNEQAPFDDYYVKTAAGETAIVRGPQAAGYPGAAIVEPSVLPGLTLIDTKPRDVFEFIRGVQSARDIGAIIEAYRRTYSFFCLGQDAMAVAAGAGTVGNWTIPGTANSYFVATRIGIANIGVSVAWEFNIIKSAGAVSLFGDQMDWRTFQKSGAGLAGGTPGGTVAELPEPWIVPPKEELRFTITNQDGANPVSADIHLFGYKVYIQ